MAIFKKGQAYTHIKYSNLIYTTLGRKSEDVLLVESDYYDYDGVETDYLEFKIFKDGDREYFLCYEDEPNSRIYAEEFNGVSIDYCYLMYEGKEIGRRLDIYLTKSKKLLFLGDILNKTKGKFSFIDSFEGITMNLKSGLNGSLKLDGFLDKETGTILFGRDNEYKEIPSVEILQKLIRDAANKL